MIHGDCCEILSQFNFEFDMIFADPPYFLSDGGISVQSGKIVCVDKGEWDKTISQEEIDKFNLKWLSACREKLKPNGTIWISGTYHNIFSVANSLTKLGYKILFSCTEGINYIYPGDDRYLLKRYNRPDNISSEAFFSAIYKGGGSILK